MTEINELWRLWRPNPARVKLELNSNLTRAELRRTLRNSALEFGSSSVELNSARTRVNVTEAYATLALSARRNTQLLAQALSVIQQKKLQMLQNLQNIAKFQNFQLDNLVDFEKC